MKRNILKCIALVLSIVCILCCPIPASAISQGTDGTELQVIQPSNLEIHLGGTWAGAAFELKTDVGMYPGVITVGEDGVISLEIGGSENYILSLVNSSIEDLILDNTMQEEKEEEAVTDLSEIPQNNDNTGREESLIELDIHEANESTVAGIPVNHIALFGGGLVLAIGALIGINIYQKRTGRRMHSEDEDDEF